MNAVINSTRPKDTWPEGAQAFIDPGFYKIANGRAWVWGVDDWLLSQKSVDEVNRVIKHGDPRGERDANFC